MIEIDGSYGEGGGSIVRFAVALSAITKKPIKVVKIRLKRKKSGLKEQHLQGIKAVADLCNGKLKGANLGSTEIEFYPGKIEKKKLKIKIGTSGSVGLLLQAVMPCCFLANHKTEIEIKGGGTFGLWSPNILYTKNVFLSIIKKLGFDAEIDIKKHGFYPKGGSDVNVKINPAKEIKPLILEERGNLKSINGISIASNFLKKAEVAERQAKAARKILGKEFSCPIKIEKSYTESLCPGSGVLVWANFENCVLGYDALGERGKPSEKVGEEAANGLIEQLKTEATVDKFMSDQILVYLAFAKKKSTIKIPKLTKHAETNIWLIKKFLNVDFKIKKNLIEVIPK